MAVGILVDFIHFIITSWDDSERFSGESSTKTLNGRSSSVLDGCATVYSKRNIWFTCNVIFDDLEIADKVHFPKHLWVPKIENCSDKHDQIISEISQFGSLLSPEALLEKTSWVPHLLETW